MLDFLLFYETKNREFESIVLLRNELVKRGYTVDYFSFWEIGNQKLIRKYRNKVKVAVMPSLYHNEEILDIAHHVAGNVQAIVNLKWEQALSKKAESDPNDYTVPKGAARNVLHLCWGQWPKQVLMNAGIAEDKLPVTGTIMMDLVKPALQRCYEDPKTLLERNGVPTDKPVVLFTSSLALATWPERLEQKFIGGSAYKQRTISRMKETYKEVLNWLAALADTGECTLVYRPHPTEYRTPQMEELIEKHGVHYVADGNIKQWIAACDYLYTWKSTSVSEAFFMGKKCAILRPVPEPWESDMALYDGAKQITTMEEFLMSFRENKDVQYIDPQQVRAYFYVEEDEYAFSRVADVLEAELHSKDHFDWDSLSVNLKVYTVKADIKDLMKWGYFTMLKLCIFLKGKKIPLPGFLKKRVESYEVAGAKERSNIITPDQFREMEEKLWPLIYEA